MTMQRSRERKVSAALPEGQDVMYVPRRNAIQDTSLTDVNVIMNVLLGIDLYYDILN